MKYIRRIVFALLFIAPFSSFAANNQFMVAAQLLAAAKNADIQQVQILVNSGADVNYTDSTGLSIVCTALMNNDVRAAQILQMYGADASRCDQQIKRYNSKNKPQSSGGLFGGLSSAQTIALAAAGAAVVVGGLFLLTDVFDPGNDNDNGAASNGTHPGNGDGGNGGGNATAAFELPYGPAMTNATAERDNYVANLNKYSPSEDGILKDNFALMSNDYKQNYLLMMNGYSPFARGYFGMRTLRNAARGPIPLADNNVGTEPAMGGRPTNVALVTANGINAPTFANRDTSSLGDRLLLWTTLNNNGNSANPASNDMMSSKYYNNIIVRGSDNESIFDDSTMEDPNKINDFDLSGFGTAIHNIAATENNNLLAKVVGGTDAGYADADFIGFMPNGQMTIFRTGGGVGMKTVTGQTPTGSYEMAGTTLATGDTLNLFGHELTVTRTGNKIVATQTVDDVTTTYTGYIGADGLLYIDSGADGKINQAYALADNNLTLAKEQEQIDYYNYRALRSAGQLWYNGDLAGGRSLPDIVANVSIVPGLRNLTTETINSVLSYDATKQSAAFATMVNKYYNLNESDDETNVLPGADATSFFNSLGSSYSPLTLFSAGSFQTDNQYSGATQIATFENAAPLVFDNLNHLFMSVVAVGLTDNGTSGATSVAGFAPSGKYALAQWQTADGNYYKARACGVAGRGANGIDPWCFAAAGVTDELAVASAAGAAGVLKSAFSYLNNKQLFTLLALTADGAYLGSNTQGVALSKDGLKSYLQSMYDLPNDYQFRVDNGEDYLDVFKEVFGYGLINLARATTPTSKIYYYDGTKIVSGAGNAYWRAASNTTFRASAAFSPRAASISAPFYDVLESVDGELVMPRVWENSFDIASHNKRGLYMGDVLGELKTRDLSSRRVIGGNIGFSMAVSERAYNDNLGGLDNLRLDYTVGDWNMDASFQHYFTDGASRFSGLSNPILAMASNAVSSGAQYNVGAWSFGARAFSGSITDSGLLENDPTISAQYMPARLGMIRGAQSGIGYGNDKIAFNAAIGAAYETDTILGAQTGGLLNLGAGDTTYVDTELRYTPRDNLTLTMRGTFARTTTDTSGEFIMGMSDVKSNAFAFGVDAGNFSFAVARPLSVTRGNLKYAYADYDIVEKSDGNYDLLVRDAHVADLNLVPEHRELRLSGTYRHNLGKFTDGAIGFIYRINPDNTNEFGNESIFMMKLSHRVGI